MRTADLLGAPIVKALLGKSVVPDTHPLTTDGIGHATIVRYGLSIKIVVIKNNTLTFENDAAILGHSSQQIKHAAGDSGKPCNSCVTRV